jgi:putative glutamine amidotransferase
VRTVPIIGLTTYYATARFGRWDRPAAFLANEYFELVAAAGARPVLLPPCRDASGGPGEGAADVVAALDGLVLVGGPDLDPGHYGAPLHPEAGGAEPVRDESERALAEAALDADLPVLAICRGLQLVNVVLGGTLHQHVPDIVEHREHQPEGGAFSDMDVTTVPGTVTAAIFGDKATVRCSHHQAVERLGEGLMVSARSVAAGLVEAAELPRARFVVGVQWHPEEGRDLRPFRALVDAVR